MTSQVCFERPSSARPTTDRRRACSAQCLYVRSSFHHHQLRVFETIHDPETGLFTKQELAECPYVNHPDPQVEVLFTTTTTTTTRPFSRPQALVGLICHCDLFQVDPPATLPSELFSTDSSSGAPPAEGRDLFNPLSIHSSGYMTDTAQQLTLQQQFYINHSSFGAALGSQTPMASIPTLFDHGPLHINQEPAATMSAPMPSVPSDQPTAGKLCTSALFGTTVSQVYPIPFESKTSLMFVFGVRPCVPVFKSAMLYISSGTGSCSTTGRLLPPPLSLFRSFRTWADRRVARTCRML
jgi:hypothetical protein